MKAASPKVEYFTRVWVVLYHFERMNNFLIKFQPCSTCIIYGKFIEFNLVLVR